jgi:hypothetical protein
MFLSWKLMEISFIHEVHSVIATHPLNEVHLIIASPLIHEIIVSHADLLFKVLNFNTIKHEIH